MLFTTTHEVSKVVGGVEISSPLGIVILTLGILFTIGLPLAMILKGKKD